MKIIINLGKGNLSDGCNNILVQLFDRERHYVRQFNGSLPAAPELAQLHHQWQLGYRAYYQDRVVRIGLLQSEGMRYSEANFKQVCQQISEQFNLWLSSDGFATIERALRTDLHKDETIQIIIIADNQKLQQLPWHLWKFVEDYAQAEISFNSLNCQKINHPPTNRQQVRVLAVLGNSSGIDLKQDLASLEALPKTELTVLTEPQLAELNEYLWQSKGWDILLFSGHGDSEQETGYIYLNETDKITIAQLKYSLSKAIAKGLQIAIFNSCEGMGLAVELADLSLPYTLVMGEPVPDQIAQVFLQYFLAAFATGKTFTLAVKEARQKLAGWETEYVCASWLPVIWQNPATDSITWDRLQTLPQPPKSRKLAKTLVNGLIGSLAVGSLIMIGRSLAWLEPVELWAYDRLMQQRPSETIDPRILVVEVTEADTNKYHYPLSDTALVEAIDLLEQHQPAAIGLDIHRPYERGTGYQELIQRLKNSPHLFPVCAYGATNESYGPPKGLSEAKLSQQMGFSDLLIDQPSAKKSPYLNSDYQALKYQPNPKVRRQLLSYDPNLAVSVTKCLTPYSLSFQLAFEYLQKTGTAPLTVNSAQQWQFGQVTLQEMSQRFGGYQQLDSNSSQIPINYRAGKPGKRITLTQLLSDNIDPQLIKNRVILLGYTANVAQDYFDTPYGTMPGVWIHAHMTSQLLSAVQDGRSLIWALPQWSDWLWVLSWSMITGAILSFLFNKPVVYSLLAVFCLILILDRVCLLLLVQGAWLPYISTILALLIITIAAAIGRVAKLESGNLRLKI
jgi:CHASE2 domain-containing sensor protein